MQYRGLFLSFLVSNIVVKIFFANSFKKCFLLQSLKLFVGFIFVTNELSFVISTKSSISENFFKIGFELSLNINDVFLL